MRLDISEHTLTFDEAASEWRFLGPSGEINMTIPSSLAAGERTAQQFGELLFSAFNRGYQWGLLDGGNAVNDRVQTTMATLFNLVPRTEFARLDSSVTSLAERINASE